MIYDARTHLSHSVDPVLIAITRQSSIDSAHIAPKQLSTSLNEPVSTLLRPLSPPWQC